MQGEHVYNMVCKRKLEEALIPWRSKLWIPNDVIFMQKLRRQVLVFFLWFLYLISMEECIRIRFMLQIWTWLRWNLEWN